MLAAVAGFTNVQIRDVASGRERHTLKHDDRIASTAFSPDGRRFATRDGSERIFLWDLNGRGGPATFSGHTMGFTAGGAFLWTTGRDGITHFWATDRGALAASLVMIEDTNDWAVATPDGRFDGTTRGIEELIAWRSGDLVLPPDRFMERRTPGLLARLLVQ
jgi:WD40 repeat protein